MQKQRILCVLPVLPEATSGGGVLLHELLQYLLSRGTVVAMAPVHAYRRPQYEKLLDDDKLRGIEWHPLEEHRAPGLLGMLGRAMAAAPSEVSKFTTSNNRRLLKAVRDHFRPTVELAVSSWALAAYDGHAFVPATRLYMVNVDPDIVRHDGPPLSRKLACAIDRPKVARLCRQALATASRVGSISERDVPALNRMGGRHDVAHIPPLMRPRFVNRSAVEPFTALITTNYTHSQNATSLRWFLRECWPHVHPRARLMITGKDDGCALARLCDDLPRVRYAGLLSDSQLDMAFARSSVVVNPTTEGSGFQIKLLDAIARGVPVVSTAFSNRIGTAIPSSDDPRTLAELINSRLESTNSGPFDYAAFHRLAVAAWDDFLFDCRSYRCL